MAYVDLDKVINVTGGGGGWTIYPDVPYPVLNQRIGIFNKPNARDTDSNGWFGLLGNSVAGICQQNYNFNQQIALAVDSWVGALSTRIKSYDFSVDIDKIDGGVIKAGLFTNESIVDYCCDIDDVNKEISTITKSLNSDSIKWTSDWIHSVSNTPQSFIVITDNNTKYMVVGKNYSQDNSSKFVVTTFEVDINNNIKATLKTKTDIKWWQFWVRWTIIWAIWKYVRTYYLRERFSAAYYYVPCIALREVNNDWTMTIVDTEFTLWAESNGNTSWTISLVSYIRNNIIYLTWLKWYHYTGSVWVPNYWTFSIDMSNVTTPAVNTILTDWIWAIAIWYDWANVYAVTSWKIIYAINWSWMSAVGTAIWDTYITYDDSFSFLDKNHCLSIDSWTMQYKWKYFLQYNTTILNDSLFVFEMDWTNTMSTSDWLVKFISSKPVYSKTNNWLEFLVNSLTPSNISNSCIGNILWIKLEWIILWTPYIELQIILSNILTEDLKLWFGITGWTYATPTLPANNGMSGNQTTARTAGSDASYIDLTLST